VTCLTPCDIALHSPSKCVNDLSLPPRALSVLAHDGMLKDVSHLSLAVGMRKMFHIFRLPLRFLGHARDIHCSIYPTAFGTLLQTTRLVTRVCDLIGTAGTKDGGAIACVSASPSPLSWLHKTASGAGKAAEAALACGTKRCWLCVSVCVCVHVVYARECARD
jgi:hypothetical protein